MASILKNRYVKRSDGLDFSRNLFNYEKRHSTNVLAGAIVPFLNQFLYPGDSPDFNFGCVIESAPLISTNLDNIYADVIAVWTPTRLVMNDWNEFLGEPNSTAFTINRSVTIPKVTNVDINKAFANHDIVGNGGVPGTHICSRSYFAEHYLAPHLGLRIHSDFVSNGQGPVYFNSGSIFSKGISVLPSRVYELNWNTFFRNENLQDPILINKTSTYGGNDANYVHGLGSLRLANKLKTFYTVATPAPSLLDVDLALGDNLPVGVLSNATGTLTSNSSLYVPSGSSVVKDEISPITTLADYGVSGFYNSPLVASVASLTVNRMYYALMLQKYANKSMKGRRAVEFYENFFGVRSSDAGHDLPSLLVQKRFRLNISQVIATSAGTDGSESNQLGTRGAFSTTGFGDSLVKNFTATEHGYLQVYLVIRGQPSICQGIDKELGFDTLLDTYIPEFDHIGPVGIETLTLNDPSTNSLTPSPLYIGYTNAWYERRNQISDVAGIMEPDQPLGYKTLAYSIVGDAVSSAGYGLYMPKYIDRIFMFPVHYSYIGDPNISGDVNGAGEPYLSNRYQFLVQFVTKGKIASVLSADSEPLKLRL